MKIGFIGLGKLGMQCAEYISDFYQVDGYDIRNVISSKINIVNSLEEVVEGKDFVFIAVPTPHDGRYDGRDLTSYLPPRDFDYTQVVDILEQLSKIDYDSLVVLISTVLPGTIREKFFEYINPNKFIYNPYLIAMGQVKDDMKDPEMIILGNKDGKVDKNIEKLISFYKKICNAERFEFGTWEEAEAIKIFYNTFISMKIVFVNMIQDVAEKNGNMNPDLIAEAISKSTKRIISDMYMKPGMGDGGPCHPRDNIALRFLSEKLDLGYDLFGELMKIREKQAENIAKKLIGYDKDIIVLGRSYKSNVGLKDGSYSLLVGNIIRRLSKLRVLYDTEPSKEKSYTYLIAHKPPSRFHNHKFNRGSIIVDPWRSIKEIPDCRISHYGRVGSNEIIFAYERTYIDDSGSENFLPNGELRHTNIPGFSFEEQFGFLQLDDILEYEGFILNKMKIEDAIRSGRKFIIPIEGIADPQYWLGLKKAKYGRQLFSFLKRQTIEALNDGQGKILLYCREGFSGCSNEKLMRILYESCDRYNIPRESVYYVTSDLSLEETHKKFSEQHYDKKIKVFSSPHFLYLTRAMYSKFKDNPKLLPQISDLDKVDRKYDFLCLNKLPRGHRYFFVFQLWNFFKTRSLISMPTNKLRKDLNYVLGVSDWREEFSHLGDEEFEAVLGYDKNKLNEMDKKFSEHLPLTIDIENDPEKIEFEIANFSYVSHSQMYNDTYFSVVTETTVYPPYVFITEKTFKVFPSLHPFIIFGCPNTIKLLKELGFKTFHPYIDESYDEEESPIKKAKMIFDEISRLRSSPELVKEMFVNSKDILIHNYNNFWTYKCCLNDIVMEMVK